MLRIFLCHSSADKPTIRDLYQRLRHDGFTPWLDEEDLVPGQDWAHEIRKEVHDTHVVVVCLSRSSVTKEGFAQKEIRIALDVADEKPEGTIFIIPARLENCEVPDRLGKWQWVNLFEQDGYDRLCRALRQRAAMQYATDAPHAVLSSAVHSVPGSQPVFTPYDAGEANKSNARVAAAERNFRRLSIVLVFLILLVVGLFFVEWFIIQGSLSKGIHAQPSSDKRTEPHISATPVNVGEAATNPAPSSMPVQSTLGPPTIIKAIVQSGNTIQLPPGHFYVYGMTTGGGAPSSNFVDGASSHVANAAGQLSAALAYGTMRENSYTTQANYRTVGGASIVGSWRSVQLLQGSNSQAGAADASVQFVVRRKSLVVVIGLASSQQDISISGLPGLQTDALKAGKGMIVAHAYLTPGTYTAVEHSAALARGQDPQHMADLIGVFLFEST
ncbi:MAG: toll/interleukin-1 receptor domain-containing protein [Candidatus Sulfotelmatobacter sp.]